MTREVQRPEVSYARNYIQKRQASGLDQRIDEERKHVWLQAGVRGPLALDQCAPPSVVRYGAKLIVVVAYRFCGFTGSMTRAVILVLPEKPLVMAVHVTPASRLFMTPLGVPA